MSDTEKQPEACVHGGPVRHFNCDCSNCKPVPVSELEKLQAEKNAAYAERNQAVALLVRMALALGWKAGVREHPTEDTLWDADWRTVVFVDLPTGQASWHFHDSEKHLLGGMPRYVGHWDGHSTPEKYKRVNAALFPPALTPEAKPAEEPIPVHCPTCGSFVRIRKGESLTEVMARGEAFAEQLQRDRDSANARAEKAEQAVRNWAEDMRQLHTQLSAANARAANATEGWDVSRRLSEERKHRADKAEARLEMNRHQADFLQVRLEEATREKDSAVEREAGNFEEMKALRARLEDAGEKLAKWSQRDFDNTSKTNVLAKELADAKARLEEVTRGRDEAVRREVGNFEEVKTHRAELMLLHARLALAKELLRNCDLSLSDPEWDAERCAFLAESAPAACVRCGRNPEAHAPGTSCGRYKPAAQPKAEPAACTCPAQFCRPGTTHRDYCPARPTIEPPPPGLYRHHKGGLYRVTGTARDSTNGPGEGRTLVLYSLVRRDPIDGVSLLGSEHAREVGQFLETVDGKPRFSREGT